MLLTTHGCHWQPEFSAAGDAKPCFMRVSCHERSLNSWLVANAVSIEIPYVVGTLLAGTMTSGTLSTKTVSRCG